MISARLRSLWDMIVQFETKQTLPALTFLGSGVKVFEIMHHQMIKEGHDFVSLEDEQFESLTNSATALCTASEYLKFHVGLDAAERLKKHIKKCAPKRSRLGVDDLSQLISFGSSLISAFVAEANARLLLTISADHVKCFSGGKPLFGQAVEDAFPSASRDIAEAGNCRALERWTASVMHSMRVLEVGLGCLAKRFGVDSGENWNKILNEIEANLRGVSKKSEGAEAERWAAEAGTHFRFIKNAFRNHAMHPNEHYDEERAVLIYDNTRSFMRHLATRLSETP